MEVTTLNISQSGMLIRAETLPAIGVELEFKFVLESGFELLTGRGKVMRHGGGEPNASPAAGIAFFDLEPAKLRILARVVELHSEAANQVDRRLAKRKSPFRATSPRKQRRVEFSCARPLLCARYPLRTSAPLRGRPSVTRISTARSAAARSGW